MFIALIIQEANGCGYSIACGGDVIFLDSTTKNDALKELHKIVIGKFNPEYYTNGYEEGYWHDQKLESAQLFDVSEQIAVPIMGWYRDAEKKVVEYKEQKDADKERAEYERLKAKFEKE